jgi:ABC-type transport system involved in multi-copper enzyme maturation permease subunit
MFLACVGKELLSHMRSLRYMLTFVLFLVLTLTGTVVRTHLYQKHVADYTEARRERMRSMEMVQWHWQSGGLGITVEKPPNPLSIFALGLENELTRSFSLSTWMVPTTGARKLSNPSFQYFLNLDFLLIINVVCSLIALLLTFDAVCGERERGTLKVLLSCPVPRDVVIVAKVVAGLLTVFVPLLLSWVLSLVYVLVVAGVTLSVDQLLRLAWIAGVSAVYVCVFFSLGIAVSSWVRRSATSLAVCLFCWIVFVLAIPNAVPMVVKRLSPIPPQSKIVLEKDAVGRYVRKEVAPKIREELSASGEYDNIMDLVQEQWRRVRIEYDKRVASIDKYYNSRISRQLLLNQQLSRLSPSASFIFATTHLAGTGIRDFLQILSDVDRFQREYLEVKAEQDRKRREEDKRMREAGTYEEDQSKRVDRIDPSVWPPFEPTVIPVERIVNESWVDVVLLAGACVVLFLMGFVGFMRYDLT